MTMVNINICLYICSICVIYLIIIQVVDEEKTDLYRSKTNEMNLNIS